MKNNLLIFDKNTCGKCNKIIYLVQLIHVCTYLWRTPTLQHSSVLSCSIVLLPFFRGFKSSGNCPKLHNRPHDHELLKRWFSKVHKYFQIWLFQFFVFAQLSFTITIIMVFCAYEEFYNSLVPTLKVMHIFMMWDCWFCKKSQSYLPIYHCNTIHANTNITIIKSV